MDDLTWTCQICRRERPDAAISVRVHDRELHGVTFQENVRYCNDNPDCEKGAETFTFLKGGEHRW